MRRRAPARAALVAAALALVAAPGCASALGVPDAASEQGEVAERLWSPVVVTAVAVGLLVYALVLWSVVRYRRRSDALPTQVAEHIPIEIAYTVVPILIVIGLFVGGTASLTAMEETVADPDVVVEVEGFQWSWRFTYPEEEVVVAGDGAGTRGPELVLPVDRTTRLRLVSVDVNHSFWVPRFLSKRDLIPGVDNEIDVTPTEEGTFVGRCAEFCGLDHWRMNFVVRVVDAEAYRAWVAERAAPATSAPAVVDEGEGGR